MHAVGAQVFIRFTLRWFVTTRLVGIPLLVLLLAPATNARADESFDWEQGSQGWNYFYTYNNSRGDPAPWLGGDGAHGPGFVFSPLGELKPWAPTPGAYFPLATYRTDWCAVTQNPTDFTRWNRVSVSLNRQPLPLVPNAVAPAPANANGGRLVLFVGEWISAERHGFYYYDLEAFEWPQADGWQRTTVDLTTDPAHWKPLHVVPAGDDPIPLPEILPDPQQWGFCLVGATAPPQGNLGFDKLLLMTVVPRPPPGFFEFDCGPSGWCFFWKYNDVVGDPLPWMAEGGCSKGFVWSPLAELQPWPNDPAGVAGAYYPFHTFGEVNPVSFAAPVKLVACLNVGPEPTGTTAELQGGALHVFVGKWISGNQFGFYRFRHPLPLPAMAGWQPVSLEVLPDAAEWVPLAGSAEPIPVGEILPDPQQWGISLVGTTARPSGGLGLDSLVLSALCQEQVTLSLPAGYCWIANNYLRGNNTVVDVLPEVLDGTILYKFVNGGYVMNLYDGGWQETDMTMLPGEGFAIESRAAQTLVFKGTLPPHPPSSTPRPAGGTYLVSCRSACPNHFEQFMGCAPWEGDRVMIPSCGIAPTNSTGTAGETYSFVNGAWQPAAPVLLPGEAAWAQLVSPTPSVTVELPAGVCWMANNFLRGNNTIAEVLPQPVQGTTLYKYQPDRGYVVNLFEFDAWSDPKMTLLPGEGFAVGSPTAQRLVLKGTMPIHPPPAQPRFNPGWYLVGGRSAYVNDFEAFMGFAPEEGDQVVISACDPAPPGPPPAPGEAYLFRDGAWEPETPLLEVGQAAWVQVLPPSPPGLLPGLCEDWYDVTSGAGWLQYTSPEVVSPIRWAPTGGVNNTPYVYSDLGALVSFPPEAVVYYPLYTDAAAHPVNFLTTGLVRLSVNASLGMANFSHGTLRLFVGQECGDGSCAYYRYQGVAFEPPVTGWATYQADVSRPNDWEAYRLAGPKPPSLNEVLAHPQRWGFAIFGAVSHLSGKLGLDGLRVAHCFGSELWDQAASTNGWCYFGVGELGSAVRWSEGGGVAGSGFAWVPLAELNESDAPDLGSALFPLATYGCAKTGEPHPVNFLERNRVSVFMNALAGNPGGAEPVAADLGDGVLSLWVGEWLGPGNYAYFRYARERLDPGANGWTRSIIALSPDPQDWQLLAQGPQTGGASGKTLVELLADPPQWGIGLFDATRKPSGVLGMDVLTVSSNPPAGPTLTIRRVDGGVQVERHPADGDLDNTPWLIWEQPDIEGTAWSPARVLERGKPFTVPADKPRSYYRAE